jgi:hypothetical protein
LLVVVFLGLGSPKFEVIANLIQNFQTTQFAYLSPSIVPPISEHLIERANEFSFISLIVACCISIVTICMICYIRKQHRQHHNDETKPLLRN